MNAMMHPTTDVMRPIELRRPAAPLRGSDGGTDFPKFASTRVSFLKDRTIYFEGDDASHHYRVVSGTVRLCKVTEDGRRQIVAFPTAGDCFGWTGWDSYCHSAEAVTPVVLEKISRRSIEEAVQSNPGLGRGVLAMLSDQLMSAHNHFLLLGRMTAAERIAAFLVELARRQDRLDDEGGTIDLPMSRIDIADYLGLTIETVSRTISAMKRDGLISATALGSIRLGRSEALEQLALAA